MKRTILCLAAAAAFMACSKDETSTPAGNDDNLVMTFDAGTQAAEANPDADNASRAGYDGLKSIWHAGDEVGLTLNANNVNLHFTQEPGSLAPDATRVRYTGSLNSPVSGQVTATAYYPYNAGVSVAGQTITASFPAMQPYVAAGYKGIPVFAKYTGAYGALSLQFKNLFSVIKLTLSKGSALTNTVLLQQIQFKGHSNETISGPMSVDLSGAAPVVSYTGSGKTTALDLGAGVELTIAPKTFYIAVPAINYASGYSFTFITDKGQVIKSAKNSGAAYAVNKVYAAPALTIDNLFSITLDIPDGALRNALSQLGLISILDGTKVGITTAGLQATAIDISGKGIADLTGLDKFPLLVNLKASNNNLASVDLSQLALLTNLDLAGNQLTNINLAASTLLTSLNLASNQLSSVNLSANTLLTSLNLSGNQLTGLNLSANTGLLSLDVSSNALTSLDLHNNILLASLKVYGNSLATLNISGLNLLNALYLNNSGTNAIALLKLTIPADAQVTHLVAEGSTGSLWTSFECLNNPIIQSISLKNNIKLLSVVATGNANLASLDVSGNILQTTLRTYGSTLTTLNFSGLKAMTGLYLNSANTNCIALAGLPPLPTLTIPANATIKNIIADGALLIATWTNFVCSSNPTVQTISLKNNLGLLGVRVTNNSSLTSLVMTGSGLGLAGVTSSGNAAGFTVTP